MPGRDVDIPLGNCGFEDVDGFSAQDVYLVGKAGDVWHFDVQTARPLDFPSNVSLYCVCCGGDGKTYAFYEPDEDDLDNGGGDDTTNPEASKCTSMKPRP
jgi:hypothetical protein